MRQPLLAKEIVAVRGKKKLVLLERGQPEFTCVGSSNGTFVNGKRVTRPTRLKVGDRIEVGPFSLRFDGTGLVSRSRSNNIELSAFGVRRVVPDRGTGNARLLLDDVTLVIRPREFVCVPGPSGSGKSTLLAILSGRKLPDEGAVAVNGANLYLEFESLKRDIAVVPQWDLLHTSLTVGAALHGRIATAPRYVKKRNRVSCLGYARDRRSERSS
jgi:ABC-type multidrug transport system fused ATPase/permease subunit